MGPTLDFFIKIGLNAMITLSTRSFAGHFY